jgi:alpha-beta hydrolase superfamily lysophospholipase
MKRSEYHFEGMDGLPLFAQSWVPDSPPAAILGIVHGFGEHSGRYDNVVTEMLAHEIGVVGFDLRGHGRSPGQRGHIHSWREYHGDLQAFLTWIFGQKFGSSTFLLGHSLGSLIVSEFILSQPKDLSGIVLSSLAVDPVGAAKPVLVAIAKLLSRIWPTFPIELGLDANALSRDSHVVKAYKTDPLVHGMTSARWGTETLAVIERIKASASQVSLPLLMLHGREDRINSAAGAQEFFRNASPDIGEFRGYVDSYHEPHNDLDHPKVVADVANWIDIHLPRSGSVPDRSTRLITLTRRFDIERYPSGWSIESEPIAVATKPSWDSANEAPADHWQSAFQQVNRARFRPGADVGHYESFFQRANHPARPLAFWIRYTVFCPTAQPESAVGQLWAIFFDGEANSMRAVKEEFPLRDCRFSGQRLGVRIGPAYLESRSLQGIASQDGETIEWNLSYDGEQEPLFLVPRESYNRKFPAAKALVGLPFANYRGTVRVNEDVISIDGWVGSQNHNWGSKHTDQYAWGQVAGFDNAEDAFLECVTARLKVGPLWTPWLTNVVLRLGDRDYALNSIRQGIRATGSYDYFTWSFQTETSELKISGKIEANRNQFVGLLYDNPPGGTKNCLNTKIARCRVIVERSGEKPLELHTQSRAAFEIVTDDRKHGVPIVA